MRYVQLRENVKSLQSTLLKWQYKRAVQGCTRELTAWDGLRDHIQNFNHGENIPGRGDVETTWQALKQHIETGIDMFIPTKRAKKKDSLPPWIDTDIKRLIRKRNKYFTIKNKTRGPRDTNHYKALKREVQRRIRQNYWSYVEEIFTPTDSSDNNSCVSKRFWSFIKHAQNDKIGVSTLKSQSTEISSDSEKAVLLNRHFQSVFTQEQPMELKQVAKQTLINKGMRQPNHPPMPPIKSL